MVDTKLTIQEACDEILFNHNRLAYQNKMLFFFVTRKSSYKNLSLKKLEIICFENLMRHDFCS